MNTFNLSEATLVALDKLSNQKPCAQNIIIDEWCKCTGMD